MRCLPLLKEDAATLLYVKMAVIDLHTHILPGMDDGSPDAATSLQMLRRQAELGVELICATSHYYAEQNSISAYCARRERAYSMLQAAIDRDLPKSLPLPAILPAAEVAYFPHISDTAELPQLCIGGTRTLMLEMPFCDWNEFQIEEVTALALDLGYQVVLVHPERFCFSKGNRRYLEQLAELPIALQVNAGSLLHWRDRKLALALLELTDTPLLGSDCHNLISRPPNLREGRTVIRKKLGAEFLRRMDENAEHLTASQFAAP